ncbi:hypothetical protein Glove_225g57 [Diversispora epigaea]|uniref:Uncharacterized protein n=1 Tax=Diversispora epigaea TaxID=1348612 RepID=A0A397IEN8_9GLOM|nr:hypothetical protein Glove_225g57 [Diversispora epigaea]
MTDSNIPYFLSDAQNLDQKTLATKFSLLAKEEVKRGEQFDKVNADYSMSVALRDDSMDFNRYSDILPFDYNRVKLIQPRPNKTDYINASYIEGPNGITNYIGAQGPIERTFDDFWLMTWEQNSYVIVMLTKEQEKGQIKCHRYWPEEVNQSMIFNSIGMKIILEKEELVPNATCVLRIIRIEKSDETTRTTEIRTVTQLHFVGWPDHGVPDTPDTLLNLVNKTNEIQQQYINLLSPLKVGAMTVHCSAGCGRTGTFCTVHTALAMLPTFKDDKSDLINYLVRELRKQRRTMVQTLAQYQYCYLAVLSKLVTER